jgi:hypothetical protein
MNLMMVVGNNTQVIPNPVKIGGPESIDNQGHIPTTKASLRRYFDSTGTVQPIKIDPGVPVVFFFAEVHQSFTTSHSATITVRPSSAADFDGNGLSDVSVYRPSAHTWYTNSDTINYGAAGDVPVPADYDHDGRTDVAVYRPSNGAWFVHQSREGDAIATFGGVPGDLPVPADFSGDGEADVGIFRSGDWYWQVSRQGPWPCGSVANNSANWGAPGDVPVPADYDGNGAVDLAIFRPSTGLWAIHFSCSSSPDLLLTYGGVPGDVPVPGDYDRDGKSDIAIYRPGPGAWYIHRSVWNDDIALTWGGGIDDVPFSGQLGSFWHEDGVGIFRPSYAGWYGYLPTSHGTSLQTSYGLPGDIPLPISTAVRSTYFP